MMIYFSQESLKQNFQKKKKKKPRFLLDFIILFLVQNKSS